MAEEVLITLVVLGAIIVVLLCCLIILICVRGPFKSPPHGLPAALPPQHSIGDAEVDALPAAVEAAAGETSGGDNAAAQAFSLSGAATDGGRDEASRHAATDGGQVRDIFVIAEEENRKAWFEWSCRKEDPGARAFAVTSEEFKRVMDMEASQGRYDDGGSFVFDGPARCVETAWRNRSGGGEGFGGDGGSGSSSGGDGGCAGGAVRPALSVDWNHGCADVIDAVGSEIKSDLGASPLDGHCGHSTFNSMAEAFRRVRV